MLDFFRTYSEQLEILIEGDNPYADQLLRHADVDLLRNHLQRDERITAYATGRSVGVGRTIWVVTSQSLLVVQTGTSVSFPNFDTVRHHVYSFSPTKTFEIKLYAGTPAKPVIFDKAGTATLGCNIHDRMIAHIHVVDTPYFGVTDGMGRVTIDLPAGDHVARIWTVPMGETSPGIEQPLRAGGGPVTLRITPP